MTVRSFEFKPQELRSLLAAARGDAPADVVLTGGLLVNVLSGEIYPADVALKGGRVAGVSQTPGLYKGLETWDLRGEYLAPGFIDAHVHIESSLMLPAEYANAVLPRGTTSVVSDPHEIANVHGLDGIRFMLRASDDLSLRVFVMLSSCVPATDMETSGARLTASELATLLDEPRVLGVAEMMNYPGVVNGSDDMIAKALLGHRNGMRVDGHAPLVGGLTLQAYAAAGISSDHESIAATEALDKLRAGVQVLIREGSTAKNLDAILPMLNASTSRFCSWATDDKQPDDLASQGHVDHNIRKAVAQGLDPMLALQMATINTARHYGLNDLGAIAPGYHADMVTFSDVRNILPTRTIAGGKLIAQDGRMLHPLKNMVTPPKNNMTAGFVDSNSFRIAATGARTRVIVVQPEQIVTREIILPPRIVAGAVVSDPQRDILKIAVIERHSGTQRIGLGLVNGLALQEGALASSIAHDSHNIVVVGASDSDMALAVRTVNGMRGGIAAVRDGEVLAQLPLPVAGLMSEQPLAVMRDSMRDLLAAARSLGCRLSNPYMQMAFLALPVIPELKLTDLGLVDVTKFVLCDIFVE
ncbi:MAG: adenine deaminase [Chloroflexota bacterium]